MTPYNHVDLQLAEAHHAGKTKIVIDGTTIHRVSSINVSTAAGQVTEITVTFTGYVNCHPDRPDDVDIVFPEVEAP